MALGHGANVAQRIPVEIRFAHFLLIEPFSARVAGFGPSSHGLIETSGDRPGTVRCRTGHLIGRALVSAEVSSSEPECDFSFDDVAEASYWSASGELSIADWQRVLAHPLGRLPWGEGWCRLRHHTRGMDGNGTGECLIQIWPAAAAPPSAVRISGSLGTFWRPDPGAAIR